MEFMRASDSDSDSDSDVGFAPRSATLRDASHLVQTEYHADTETCSDDLSEPTLPNAPRLLVGDQGSESMDRGSSSGTDLPSASLVSSSLQLSVSSSPALSSL